MMRCNFAGRIRKALALLVALVASPHFASASAQSSDRDLVVDHVYIVVAPGAQSAIDRLTAAGFTFDTAVSRHVGSGTASRAAIFANAYLELLWVDSTVPVHPGGERSVRRFGRAADWRITGVSPFGIGLRRSPSGPDSIALPGTRITAEWMRSGTSIIRLGADADSMAATIFVVPRYMAQDAWAERLRRQSPELFRHSLGVQRLTAVRVWCGSSPCRSTAALLGPREDLRFESGGDHLLELRFDEGTGGRLDFRPQIPLVVRY